MNRFEISLFGVRLIARGYAGITGAIFNQLRTFGELASFASLSPVLSALAPTGDGHPVLVFPGLGADDITTLALRRFLTHLGYDVYGWGPGDRKSVV